MFEYWGNKIHIGLALGKFLAFFWEYFLTVKDILMQFGQNIEHIAIHKKVKETI